MLGIKICQLADGSIGFQPDRPGAKIGQPLGAKKGDLVVWINMTNRDLELISIPSGTFITKPIKTGDASDPLFEVKKNLTYSCVDPAMPQHSIIIAPPAPAIA